AQVADGESQSILMLDDDDPTTDLFKVPQCKVTEPEMLETLEFPLSLSSAPADRFPSRDRFP
ncbi:unnamed protein product, partial [Ilex paraguariensis]